MSGTADGSPQHVQCMLTVVPEQWKTASVKLLGKQAAQDDPSVPSNFRPIALTSCVGKLLTTILWNRWLSFMITNNYFDHSVPKAFMPKTPGCIEHHLKLASVIHDAAQVTCCVLARLGQCIWKCAPFTDFVCSLTLSCSPPASQPCPCILL